MSDTNPVATVRSPVGVAYRGKPGCKDPLCTTDGNRDRCYGWHCLICDGRADAQGACLNRECEGRER